MTLTPFLGSGQHDPDTLLLVPPQALVAELDMSSKLFKTLEIRFYFWIRENHNSSCYKIEAGPAFLQNYSGVIGRSWYRNTCHVSLLDEVAEKSPQQQL
jgi:hypothetical protein